MDQLCSNDLSKIIKNIYIIFQKYLKRFWKVTFYAALLPQLHGFNIDFPVHCKTRDKVWNTRWQSWSCLICPPPVSGYAKQVNRWRRAHRDSKAKRRSKVRPGAEQYIEIMTLPCFSIGVSAEFKSHFSKKRNYCLCRHFTLRDFYLQNGLYTLQEVSGWVSNYNATQNQFSHY